MVIKVRPKEERKEQEEKKPLPEKNNKKKKRKVKKPPKREQSGRPTTYTEEIASYIITELMKGRTLLAICREEDMPAQCSIFNWLNPKHPSFQRSFLESYIIAREVQAEIMADEIKEIADDGSEDYYIREVIDGKTGKVTRTRVVLEDNIKARVIKIDTRKWLAAHLLPRKYSDRFQLTGEGDKPLIPSNTKMVVNFIKPTNKEAKEKK